MIDLSRVAPEIQRILRTYRCELFMYDADTNRVYEPEQAVRFFDKKRNLMVVLLDDGDNSSINVHLSASTDVNEVQGMIQTIRVTAKQYGLLSHERTSGKELSPKDFSGGIVEGQKEPIMDLTENMYGTTRSSYLRLPKAKMIVRHSSPVNENSSSPRSRHIARIFVEDSQNQRFLMPTRHLAPARAMTQHLSNGGEFADTVGSQITRMAKDFANLGTCGRFITRNGASLPDPQLAENVLEGIRKCRKDATKSFSRLYSHYVAEAERVSATSGMTLNEDISASVGGLRKVLACEGNELPNEILESVMRMFGESASAAESETAFDDNSENLSSTDDTEVELIGGFKTPKSVWENFSSGIELKLVGEVRGVSPDFRFDSQRDELVGKLASVVEVVADYGLANFLSHVADTLDSATKLTPEVILFQKIAMQALKLGGLTMKRAVSESNSAIRDYMEWFRATSPDSVLMEDADDADLDDAICDPSIEDCDDDSGDDVPESLRLSREDVIMPKSASKSFDKAVKTVDQPSTTEDGKVILADDTEMCRMRELAGIRR